MLTELRGKGGHVCEAARTGAIRCPLIIRPTSEDVITGEIFQVLSILNPRWWVSDLLNYALQAPRFRRQVYRKFRIELWKRRPSYPRELLPWREGRTEVDATITWENPPTTVFIEMKYGSGVSPQTTADPGTTGFPSDQLIRNLRVGLLECGWIQEDRLFQAPRRDFVLILLRPGGGHELIKRYRDKAQLRAGIPRNEICLDLPLPPYLGELRFDNVTGILKSQRRWFSRAERSLIDQLVDYLDLKIGHYSNKQKVAENSLVLRIDQPTWQTQTPLSAQDRGKLMLAPDVCS